MKFHTQLKANDIFKFSLAYTYSGLQLILAIAMVAVGVYMCVHVCYRNGCSRWTV